MKGDHHYKSYLLWMSKAEAKELEKLTARTGLSYATVLRRLIMSKPIKERPNPDFLELINSVNAIGNNLNQLVKKVHTLNTVDPNDVNEAEALLKKTYLLLRDWGKIWR